MVPLWILRGPCIIKNTAAGYVRSAGKKGRSKEMKNAKKLTRDMKTRLAGLGLNPLNWYYVKNTPDELVIINKQSRRTRIIRLEAQA
jgi:hypothetical protein